MKPKQRLWFSERVDILANTRSGIMLGKSMNVVNSYTYLGFTFKTKLERRNFRLCSKRQEGSFSTYVKP